MALSLNDPKNIDRINILLVFVSLAIAIKVPFELFLFSYAILGPLHYLTEINWLNKKDYFFKRSKHWIYFFITCCLVISIFPISRYIDDLLNTQISQEIHLANIIGSRLITGALLFSVILVSVKKTIFRVFSLLPIIGLIFLFDQLKPNFFNLLGFLIPTVVHVYIFTLLFVLFGARKSKSKPGYYLSILIALVPFIISTLNIPSQPLIVSKEVQSNFTATNMIGVSSILTEWFSPEKRNIFSIAIKVQIFISFAYTYHYLNWFSKTSIIGWQKTLKGKKAYIIIGFWLISILLYFLDYKLGFTVLFFLSFLHVLLEFPLNIVTVKSLFSLKRGHE
ncbi:MAG: hypothetical protein CMP61_00190 [Flavobacteriales bacterium]|nr:hypothetical protein [Flavobacteriales bacterium]|tara:strand:- start:17464 stop:18471 length:1008 start_codon:yes stop_codon:yes gene_type:complete